MALAVPTLLAFGTQPSPLAFNEIASIIGWGAFLLAICGTWLVKPARLSAASCATVLALLLLLGACVLSPLVNGVPWTMTLAPAGVLASAIAVFVVGAAANRAGRAQPIFLALCVALVLTGLANSLIAIAQVSIPNTLDDWWIAQSLMPGRATGNLRQPNYLCLVLLWAIVAVIWLRDRQWIGMRISAGLSVFFVFAVVLTGSRTAVIEVLGFAVWGVIDRRLDKGARRLLVAMPLLFASIWGAVAVWASTTSQTFGGSARVAAGESLLGSRTGVLENAIALIQSHPWAGVGFGGFNFAWTLTPFDNRHTKGFDNAHNLPVQLVTEMGVPAGLLVTALLVFALWGAWRRARLDESELSVSITRSSFALIVVVGVFTLVELPLWYPMFLLPTAFWMALCLEGPKRSEAPTGVVADNALVMSPSLLVAMAMCLGGVYAYTDYQRVRAIFQPTSPQLLQKRIAVGRESLLFGQYADYAAAVSSAQPLRAIDAFPRATHQILDPPLLVAWASAFSESGDVERARYLAQRLKEFKPNVVDSTAYFAPCTRSGDANLRAVPSALPFQCFKPTRSLEPADFR